MRNTIPLLLFLVFSFVDGLAQSAVPQGINKNLYSHVKILSSDKMEGREAGTAGERLAAAYIEQKFRTYEILPAGDSAYYQSFDFLLTRELGSSSKFALDDIYLSNERSYFPLNFSANGTANGKLVNVGFGIQAKELDYDDYSGLKKLSGKIFVMEVGSPDGIHPHSKYAAYHDLRTRVQTAEKLGAAAVILINTDPNTLAPKRNYDQKVKAGKIPVVYLEEASKVDGVKSSQVVTDLQPVYRTGRNVVGKIDNGAELTIVIGAHYDHLGFGENGGSLHRGTKQIHNGADDNASGTAVMLELSNHLRANKYKAFNYLFIAFSGEEKGLLGSDHFVENPTIDLKKVNFMLNMDMVGKLKTDEPFLSVNGVGTSIYWDSLLNQIQIPGLRLKTTKSGVGPSDHTSFYLQDIPVLHLFTGSHGDYHKPTDDLDGINFLGMIKVYSLIEQIITGSMQFEAMTFAKTNDSDNSNAPRFTVTLGVVPDYGFEGDGMRIDGVTEERPAANAGIQKGDTVLKIGAYEVPDMMGYMRALGMFKKGDKVDVIVKRGEEEKTINVTF